MTVGRDYLLSKPSGPSAPKLFLDTRIVPLVVNVAGEMEVALQRVSVRTGVRPAIILGSLMGIVSLTLLRMLHGSRTATDT